MLTGSIFRVDFAFPVQTMRWKRPAKVRACSARSAHPGPRRRNGRLVAPFDIELKAERMFHVVCPDGHQSRPKIKAFCDWLESEVRVMQAGPFWPKADSAPNAHSA